MRLSVGYNFDRKLIKRLSNIPHVREIYGKLNKDLTGGGRSSYTLPVITRRELRERVKEAHSNGIEFNYLLNGADLGGIEQTRKGHKGIRKLLDFLKDTGVDSVTVASPFLLRLIKRQYPKFKIRVSVFAVVDTPLKAQQWEEMGADTICLSGISCNRDFKTLKSIREAVDCDLQLIANAGCLMNCAYEITHMNMLANSSRSKASSGGFCLDYCFLNCSMKRLNDPVNLIRSTWIRPQDLSLYQDIGYDNFKIVERSSPSDLILTRVKAYSQQNFSGNLYQLTAPVARIKKEQGITLKDRLRIIKAFLHPEKIKVSSLLKMKEYAETVIPHRFEKEDTDVYLDTEKLDGFIKGLSEIECSETDCKKCDYCASFAEKSVYINPEFKKRALEMGEELDKGLIDSTHWL